VEILAMSMESRFAASEFRAWLEFRRPGSFIAAAPHHSANALREVMIALPGKDHALLWMATSGTTTDSAGFPRRWVGHTRESLMASAKSVCQWLDVRPSDRWARVLPLHHMGGLAIEFRAAHRGFKVLAALPGWNPGEFAHWMTTEKATIASLVPTQVHDLVRARISCPATVRAAVVGADRLAPELLAAARDLRWPLLPSYGMTETASMIACHRPGEEITESIPFIDGVEARVEASASSDPATEGRLQIGAPQLFHSELLWSDQQYELRRRPSGWWTSEDRVRLSADSRHLIPLGRDQDFVKILGEGIHLADLDARASALLRSKGFDGEAAFAVRHHERRGSNLVLVLTKEFSGALEVWNSACSPVERAGSTVIVEALPRTELGKLRRSAL
jgi:O-succinylbenzoic acid--CoA ligase